MSLLAAVRLTALLVSIAVWLPFTHGHSRERNPITYLSRLETPVLHAPANRVHALSSFSLTFDLHNSEQHVRLTLAPNHDLLPSGATVQYMNEDGSLQAKQPLNRLDYRVFKGSAWVKHTGDVEWTNVGWARIMMSQDGKQPLFEGVFRIDGDNHHVQSRSNYMQTKHLLDPVADEADAEYMVVWRDSDISADPLGHSGHGHMDLKRDLDHNVSCSADRLDFNAMNPLRFGAVTHPLDDLYNWGSISTRRIFGRQTDGQTTGNSAGVNLRSTIGSTSGCPSTKRVALVGIATDCTYTGTFNSSESARDNIIQVLNAASTQFEDSFNITLGLQNLIVNNGDCPGTPATSAPWNVDCGGTVGIQDRLNLFSSWRGQQRDNNTFWTLLSNCPDNGAVGLAWLGQACVNEADVRTTSSGNETVSGANVVVRTGSEWQVLAHEIGHTFGAVHDCTSGACAQESIIQSQQCCPFSATSCDAQGRFLMNPSTRQNALNFSPCSIGNVCSAIGRNQVNTRCLVSNKDVNLFMGSQCGNGIVESGEECDCGGEIGCGNNPCCNPTTCEFTTNAVCDPSNEACCSGTCQFSSRGSVCRASTGVCDPEETCDGTSANCPSDVTSPDGESCGNSSMSLTCSSGQCTSRDLQCKTIMGSFTQGNDTYACSHSGCQVSCASPEFGRNVCFSMQQFFLDGTSCQGGGKCRNGQCKGSSVGKEIRNWIDDNKTLVIALSSVLGSLFVLVVISCMFTCWRRRRNRTKAPPPPPMACTGNWPVQNQWAAQGNSPAGPNQGWQPSVRYA